MKAIEAINQEVERISAAYCETRNELAAIEALRETSQSSLLFYFTLEKFMQTLEKKEETPGPGLLKHYLKSPYKEDYDSAYYGDEVQSNDGVQLVEGVQITKGLALRLLEKANLWNTFNAYAKYIVLNEAELNGPYFSSEDNKFADLDNVLEILFEEHKDKNEA